MKAFGVGCFHFGLHTPAKVTLNKYVSKLQQVLEKNNSITNIKIDCEGGEHEFEIEEELGSLNDIGYVVPHINYFNLSFDVYIPYRVQESLFRDKLLCTTENFNVRIIHDWHGPLTIVESLNPDSSCQPSDGVIAVRNFLESNIDDDFIRFEFLGPSPFHANFFVMTSNQANGEQIEFNHEETKGYDKIEFTCPESIGLDDALNEIIYELESELGFFYWFTANNRRRSRKWEELESAVEEFIDATPKGLISEARLQLSQRYEVDRLIRDISNYKMSELMFFQMMKENYAGIYENDAHMGFLKKFNKHHIEAPIDFPVDELISVIKFISERRGKAYELIFMILAAICGGVIGSLMTLVSRIPGT